MKILNAKVMATFTHILVKRHSEYAKLPTLSYDDSAGMDLYAAETVTIPPGKSRVVATDLEIQIPLGYCGKLMARSGIAFDHRIMIGAGLIDAGFEAPIKVLVFNLGDEDYHIDVGSAFCQIVITPVTMGIIVERLPEKGKRGGRGFGSSDTPPAAGYAQIM